MQPIDNRHPAKKQGPKLCGCQHGVILNDSCPEWHRSLHETISPNMPLCDVAKSHMLLAIPDNSFVHYDLVQLQFFTQECCYCFINILLECLNWAPALQDDAQSS
jgi:hypothetical protein